MARSTSPVFNEAPSSSEMVTKTSSSSSPSSDASVSAASASPTTASSTAVVAPAPPTSSDCLKASAASPSGVDAPDSQCFPRVSPAVLQSVQTSLTGFRKSCLKRSKATAHSPPPVETEKPVEKKPVQKNRRRCWQCKVKVGLTAVTCRCDFTFCNKHRYAEEHACEFNFKTAGKRKLEAENPLVVPRKVARIN